MLTATDFMASLEQASPAELLARVPEPQRDRELKSLFKDLNTEEIYKTIEHEWRFWSRPKQVAPTWAWDTWVLLGGRGVGKTRTGAEFIHEEVEAGRMGRIALIARTAADVRDVMVGGESGILATAKPWSRPTWKPSSRKLIWPNGAIASTYSADEPDSLRGPQFDGGWGDEVAAWRYPLAWDNFRLGLRLGKHPKSIVTTTPRPTSIIKNFIQEWRDGSATWEAGGPPPRTVVYVASTFDNASNLPASYISDIVAKYHGTRLGRQELYAEILDDVPGALWNRSMIEDTRVFSFPNLDRIVVGVDPQGATSEGAASTGIIVVGTKKISGVDHGFLLADMTLSGLPAQWARQVLSAYNLYKADRIVAEVNHGGDMVEHTIRSVEGGDTVPITKVRASRGKIARAEPVSALYEQNRFHHVGVFPELEDQQCEYVPGEPGVSPDRMDAAVWAASYLMVGAWVEPAPTMPESFTRASSWDVLVRR